MHFLICKHILFERSKQATENAVCCLITEYLEFKNTIPNFIDLNFSLPMFHVSEASFTISRHRHFT